MKRLVVAAAVVIALIAPSASSTAHAHRDRASEASALSMLPVAVSVAVPVGLVMSGASVVVIAVSAVAEGTLWVLERASDGARFSITVGATGVGAVSLGVGTVVEFVACSTGWVLSAAGKAIAFVPNELGKALLYNERVTR